jgi:hypothetical protein
VITTLEITPRFRRSVRIDADFASVVALDGFHCPRSFQVALGFMASHIQDTGQSAFTWTGPYGGGKSSLALALACLFGAPKPIRDQATLAFGQEVIEKLKTALPYFPSRWNVLPIVVEKQSLTKQIARRLGLLEISSGAEILIELERQTKDRGLLLILDELGRGLEAAAAGDGDLHILQDIAELAARSDGRLILLGILHQSFGEYAERLGTKSRDSWAKIQGRFVDISISVSLEETVELIGEALGHPRAVRKAINLAEQCVEHLRPQRNKVDAKRLAGKLARAAPLHPVTACLLGPLSKRRFGQNQRSVFSFLSSAEPFALQDALTLQVSDDFYPPYLLWSYLQANYEAAILTSPDARRWSLANDVLERCAARGASHVEQTVLKTLAILELLKDRSGLSCTPGVLELAINSESPKSIELALKQLEKHSEIVFRRHSGAYVIYAGSDFDIEARLNEIVSENHEIDLTLVRILADLQPILAKRHHERTGAMRWFELALQPVSELKNQPALAQKQDVIGRVVIALPLKGENLLEVGAAFAEATATDRSQPMIVGFNAQAHDILDLARELMGLNALEARFPELRGDTIARREIDARTSEVRQKLEDMLSELIDSSTWFETGQQPRVLSKKALNERLSMIADTIFYDAPIVRNELLNCFEPSTNAVSARTKLMKRMALHGNEDELGFDGDNYPAERGLYISLLQQNEMHDCDGFREPTIGHTLYPLWREADALIDRSKNPIVSADQLIEHWGTAPIGLKRGLGPVFVVAYILSRRDRVAVYGEGVFQSNFHELCVEYLARDPKDIGLRRVEMAGFIGETLSELGSLLSIDQPKEPLYVARRIIGEFDELVPWTARTQSLSPQTLRVREILKRASDPNKLLFDDLPRLNQPRSDGTFDPIETAISLRDALAEMRAAYPKVLDELKSLMLRELDVRPSSNDAIKDLRDRADNIRQIGGDLRLEAFIGRLTQFHGTREDMEGIASVAANKLPRDWNDGDRERAGIGIIELAGAFLKTETLARVKGRAERRHALALVLHKANSPRSLYREFEVSDTDWSDVTTLAFSLDQTLMAAGQDNNKVVLAALMEVASKYLNPHGHEDHGAPI